uniref:Uncharacterized protein n=1 Tax=Rhizophora mucronata TaxID=61149 RepID=A0A2P2PAX3_RHIMU
MKYHDCKNIRLINSVLTIA